MQTEHSVPAHKQHRKKAYDLVPRSISRVNGNTGDTDLYTGDNIVLMEYVDMDDWVFPTELYCVLDKGEWHH